MSMALNASVEASNAGKYGRGFSVIAKEIRNLATKTGNESKSIMSWIRELTQQLEVGKTMMKTVQESTREIQDNLKEVKEHIEFVTASSKENSLGINQIQESIFNIERLMNNSISSLQEISISIDEIDASSTELKSMVDQFKH
jgi:methyl-accepting chemotaxis protein